MLEEFSQQLHELDRAEIAAHSDKTRQEQQQEERQEQPMRRSMKARGKRAAITHQQANNNDERFAGWQGITALGKIYALAIYIRSSALYNHQWYHAVGKQLGMGSGVNNSFPTTGLPGTGMATATGSMQQIYTFRFDAPREILSGH